VTLFALGACAGSGAGDPFAGATPAARFEAPTSISVYAQNENEEDVVIYLLSVGRIERVGSVAPERARSFQVPWDSTQELRIRVEILAGPRYTTNALSTVSPGDRVEVWVPEEARQSFIRRR
jgi:hypothetical protein